MVQAVACRAALYGFNSHPQLFQLTLSLKIQHYILGIPFYISQRGIKEPKPDAFNLTKLAIAFNQFHTAKNKSLISDRLKHKVFNGVTYVA